MIGQVDPDKKVTENLVRRARCHDFWLKGEGYPA